MPYTLRKLFRWESSLVASFFQLAIPIVIQSLVMASLHIIDNVMIGQLGEMEMAAVTQANRLTFLFQLTIFGLSGATSTFVSQYWGKRDIGSIRQVQGLSLIVSGAIAILFMVLSIGFPLFVMRKFLREAPAIAMGAQYLQIVGVGYLFQALTQTYATVQKSTEQPRLPMIASIIAILTNTVLNYAFIFGRLGAPRLGIQGGAMATTIATGVEFLIVCLYGYRKKLASAAKLRELMPPSWAFVRKYFRITTPVVANECLWSMGIVLYSVVYGHMGTATVAAVSIYNTVEQIGFAFIRGVVHTCAVLVGKRIGAGDEQDANLTARRMMVAAVGIALFAGALLAASSGWIVQIFNVSENVRSAARALICINAAFMPLNALNTVIIVGVMRAGGDVTCSLLLDAGTIWVIGVPLVALAGLGLGWSITAVFLLAQVENAVKLTLGLLRLRSGKWVHNLVHTA